MTTPFLCTSDVFFLAISFILPGARRARSEMLRKAPPPSGTSNSMFNANEVGFTAMPLRRALPSPKVEPRSEKGQEIHTSWATLQRMSTSKSRVVSPPISLRARVKS